MKRMMIIILTSACILVYASGNVAQRPADGRLSPRLLNYQGYLTDALGNPITNPSVSMVFSIYDAVSAGNLKWTETQSTVGVDKGIFNVLLGGATPIPDSVFRTSTNRWLELSVGGQTLTPRTRIVSVPFAYSATYSDTALYAVTTTPDFDWTYRITDTADTTLQTCGRWGLARFGNTMYGNADSTHVNLGISSTTGANGQNYKYNTVGGGYNNAAVLSYSTVAGGVQNNAGGQCATVGGGSTNIATSECATVAGGNVNAASNYNATVSGGQGNIASGYIATVGGGKENRARGAYSVVSGGGGPNYADSNSAMGDYSAIGGGRRNRVWGFATIIGGGFVNTASQDYATVSGGTSNTASGFRTTVSGGSNNTASGSNATVGGGDANTANGGWATVGGGLYNSNAGDYSAIIGGYADTIAATGDYSYLFGINSNLTQDSTFMVDLPHVWFGTEANGYEFPYGRGTDGQVMKTNGSGLLSWGSIAYVDSARVAANAHKLQGKDTTDFNDDYVNEGQVNSIDSLMLQNNSVTMPKISQGGATASQVIKWNGIAWQPAADSSMDSDWTISGSNMYSAVSGNVGIGTTTPYGPLDILNWINGRGITVRGANDNNVIRLENNATGGKTYWLASTGGTSGTGQGKFAIVDEATLAERIVVAGNGNVGIGTTAPAEKLDVAGTARVTGFKMPTSATNGYVLTSDASGAGTWQSIPADNHWSYRVTDGNDTTLETGGRWGIARFGNTTYGNADSTHVNLGLGSVTGTAGQDYKYCTVGGGYLNTAGGDRATVNGGTNNTASGWRSTISGGWYNTASNFEATVAGGTNNNASGNQSTIAGGGYNVSSGASCAIGGGYGNSSAGNGSVIAGGESNNEVASFAAIGGGKYNTVNGDYSLVGGGENNQVLGYYSAILGGFADTIFATGYYSYLFGINSNLTQDSTFMVDLPHIRFGKESGGYEFPVTDGTNGQALVTNGSGQVSWGTPSKHTTYTPSSSSDPKGNMGDMAWDDSYVYVKTSTGWKRSALSTW